MLPKLRGYQIRQEVLVLDSGATTHKLVNVPLAELEEWDRTHDVKGEVFAGRVAASGSDSRSSQENGVVRERFGEGKAS